MFFNLLRFGNCEPCPLKSAIRNSVIFLKKERLSGIGPSRPLPWISLRIEDRNNDRKQKKIDQITDLISMMVCDECIQVQILMKQNFPAYIHLRQDLDF